MDSINFGNLKIEKANASRRHCQLRKMVNLFRFVELCVVLVLISRFSIQLPVAVKNSGKYFRGLSVVLVSPRFVFIVGNVIVITLFAKSGQFSGKDSKTKNSEHDLYTEFMEKSEKKQYVYISGEKENCYRRTKSEKLNHDSQEKSGKALRRAETEKCRKSMVAAQESVKNSYPEDGMSNEEFRRTIEAFIAKQQRLRKEEEFCVN